MPPKIKFELKTPKGTKDCLTDAGFGPDMIIREQIFSVMRSVFQRHGAMELDTPTFELTPILTGKYGEDSKLIYQLADQGGEDSSLVYDCTVPMARWLAQNAIENVKRYTIKKVYRRDQPAMNKGRQREFYQADIDFAGANYDPMLPDAEIIRITTEVFSALGWADTYTININHRKILDGMFQVCGVPDEKIRAISSAVDKLDKAPWADVKKEMTAEKGLDEEVADKIGEWVILEGKQDVIEKLRADEKMAANELIQQGLSDMEILFEYLEVFGCLDRVSFSLSLARGLDYYTGIIYEVRVPESAPPVAPADGEGGAKKKKSKSKNTEDASESVGVGSVAAGGRYDNLVGMFSGKKQVPCVGISFGIERIFSLMKARMAAENEAAPSTVDVYVMALGSKAGLVKERLRVSAQLWDAGVKTEFLYKVKPKLPPQFKAAESNQAPFAVILGDDEIEKGVVKIKELGLPEGHPHKDGELVDMKNLVPEVQKRLARKRELDEISRKAGGLKVVGGLRGEDIDKAEAKKEEPAAEAAAPAAAAATEEVKPAEAQ
ncbi:histidyl-tRNA synthetase [Verticillium dahliae]|nr:histidyl-tRNA synthetase [Verticillium dahliae]